MGKRRKKQRKHVFQHAKSVLAISGVIIMLACVLSWGSSSLKEKNAEYKAQEAELQAQLDEQEVVEEENKVLEEHVGTDEYIKEMAKGLGLVEKNELWFKAE